MYQTCWSLFSVPCNKLPSRRPMMPSLPVTLGFPDPRTNQGLACLKNIARFVSSCGIYQHKNRSECKISGYLQSLRVNGPFVRFHINFKDPFPLSAQKNKYIIIGIESFTKYVVAKVVQFATATKFLVKNGIFRHGMIAKLPGPWLSFQSR